MNRTIVALAIAAAAFVGCGSSSSSGEGPSLQSQCVLNNLGLSRTLADGASCYSFGYSDCGSGAHASECLHYCAYDRCQSNNCSSDQECPGFCKEYVISDVSFGRWCDSASCLHGSIGCPCSGTTCTPPDSYWTVSCNAAGLCTGTDGCPSGCRAGSVCCGGAFCSGNCIGTPCCT